MCSTIFAHKLLWARSRTLTLATPFTFVCNSTTRVRHTQCAGIITRSHRTDIRKLLGCTIHVNLDYFTCTESKRKVVKQLYIHPYIDVYLCPIIQISGTLWYMYVYHSKSVSQFLFSFIYFSVMNVFLSTFTFHRAVLINIYILVI